MRNYRQVTIPFKQQFAPLLNELTRRSRTTRTLEAALTNYILHHPLEFEMVSGLNAEVARQLLAQGTAGAHGEAVVE